MKYIPWQRLAASALALTSASALAVPSGLTPVPKIKYPEIGGGRTVPAVVVNSDVSDAKTLYVKPTEGVFVSQGVVKSPLSRCDLVQEELKISEINVKARVAVAQALREAQANYARNQETLNKYIRSYESLVKQQEPLKGIADGAAAAKKEALTEIKRIQDEITGVRELISIEKDKEKIGKLEAQITKLDGELDAAKAAFIKTAKEAREAQKTLSGLEIELAEAEGKRNGYQKTLAVQLDELTKIQRQLDDLQEASEKVLRKYSERIGGYATFTADFAPSEYLEALRKANPDYAFQYIPTVTASVDATIPGKVRDGSALAARTGTMILESKWSDPRNVRDAKKLERLLLPTAEKLKDPVKESQLRIAQLESSLVGTKYLALQLSILGYCALKEPESLASEFNGGVADTFKLALYYTYPVNYQLKLGGRYNQYDALYDFYKVQKSSSWFGLSVKEKREHIQRISHSKAFDIKIQPIGAELTVQDSLVLAEKIKEQLWYYSVERYLEKGTPTELARTEPGKPGEGLSNIGKTLMLVPNPFCFWGGLILSSLGSMFGSASSESIQDISKTSWVDLNYEAGFTALQSGDLTIGDLKKAKVTEGR